MHSFWATLYNHNGPCSINGITVNVDDLCDVLMPPRVEVPVLAPVDSCDCDVGVQDGHPLVVHHPKVWYAISVDVVKTWLTTDENVVLPKRTKQSYRAQCIKLSFNVAISSLKPKVKVYITNTDSM